MNHIRIYCNIVQYYRDLNKTKADFKSDGVYSQGHHIIPRSYIANGLGFGLSKKENDQHIVEVPMSVHVLLHKLLYKSYEYDEDLYAVNFMLGHAGRSEDEMKITKSIKRFLDSYSLSEEARKKRSESVKKAYIDNPDLGKKISEATKKAYRENPELGKKLSKSLKKAYRDNPELGKKLSESVKKAYREDPEIRKKISESVKKAYREDPELRKKMSEAWKKNYRENPGARKKMSAAMKKAYIDNPDLGKKISESMKKTYRDNPELGKKLSESRKKMHKENPEIRKKLSAAKKGTKQYFDPRTGRNVYCKPSEAPTYYVQGWLSKKEKKKTA